MSAPVVTPQRRRPGPAGRATVSIGRPPAVAAGQAPGVHAFIDLSNIWFGLRAAAQARDEPRLGVRLSAGHFADLLRAGREPYGQLAVANADVPASVIEHLRQEGEVLRRESGHLTRTEQANDETLQVRMYEALHTQPRGIMVLATGDGAGAQERRGFIPALEAARQHHWSVEVASWAAQANRRLRDWAHSVDAPFIDLDDSYYAISFVEQGRIAQTLSLIHRPTTEMAR